MSGRECLKLYSKENPVNKRCAVEGTLRAFQVVRILDMYAAMNKFRF